jgi:hypothetical protein
MQQETDNQEDAMQLDTEDGFPSDDESMLDDDQSMCNDPSDNETSGDDRRVSDDDSDIMESTDEETGGDTFANDITGLLSDDSDDDTSSERREFGMPQLSWFNRTGQRLFNSLYLCRRRQ